jgi:hypothetical protein
MVTDSGTKKRKDFHTFQPISLCYYLVGSHSALATFLFLSYLMILALIHQYKYKICSLSLKNSVGRVKKRR